MVQANTTAVSSSSTYDHALFNWAQQHHMQIAKVEIAVNALGIRGLFAIHPLKKGQVLANIPWHCIIHTEQVRESNEINGLLQGEIDTLSDHELIALFMLCQATQAQCHWQAYYNSLPQDLSQHPLFFTESDLAQITNTRILSILKKRWRFLTQSYERLLPILQTIPNAHLMAYIKTRTLINTRCFTVERFGEKQAAMIPIMEMMNHNEDPSCHWSSDEKGVYFTLLKDVNAGEELTDNYGKKSKERYFANYGFYPQR
ncbi:SET domain-containing protein [uncultured Shewanella sp.]|uniref:SET domain-containing protein n=1 Tax=uncultured Shewanella sp. TaxID=173975 RepID=UPI002630001B|nr:SET domain-containing protein [uncultured Shewanella sp.]